MSLADTNGAAYLTGEVAEQSNKGYLYDQYGGLYRIPGVTISKAGKSAEQRNNRRCDNSPNGTASAVN